MHRLYVAAGLLALAILASGLQAEDKKDEKPKNIKAIMKKAHAGDEAFKMVVTSAAKEKEYAKAATALKAWVAISSHLAEFDPPRGDKDNWKKECKKYAEDVKALAKAVDDKDDSAITAKLVTVNKGCGSCHTAHKPPKKK